MGPPPRRGNAGKVIGILAAVLAGAYILFRGITEVLFGDAPSEPASYTLTLPPTLEDGGLTLAEDMSDTFRPTIPHRTLEPVAGRYDARSGNERLVLAGYAGFVRHHERSRNEMLDGMEENAGTELAVPRREITPAGTDEPLSCEVLVKNEGGTDFTIPVCVWSDPGTVGAVMDNSPRTSATAPDAVDLDAFAERVSGIRDEVRVPAD
ncbi:MAG TPA: hypothetical protein VFY14_10520 [Streptomyces sp.]|nr:hypothetical protein [Streptomyces sp.]